MQSLGPLSFSQGLARRLSGPFPARFVLQPLVAITLGIRDGVTTQNWGGRPSSWPSYLQEMARFLAVNC
jgi:hypothetical protein